MRLTINFPRGKMKSRRQYKGISKVVKENNYQSDNYQSEFLQL